MDYYTPSDRDLYLVQIDLWNVMNACINSPGEDNLEAAGIAYWALSRMRGIPENIIEENIKAYEGSHLQLEIIQHALKKEMRRLRKEVGRLDDEQRSPSRS